MEEAYLANERDDAHDAHVDSFISSKCAIIIITVFIVIIMAVTHVGAFADGRLLKGVHAASPAPGT